MKLINVLYLNQNENENIKIYISEFTRVVLLDEL